MATHRHPFANCGLVVRSPNSAFSPYQRPGEVLPAWKRHLGDVPIHPPVFDEAMYTVWDFVHRRDPWHRPLDLNAHPGSGRDEFLRSNERHFQWVMHRPSGRIFLFFIPERLSQGCKSPAKLVREVYTAQHLIRVNYSSTECEYGVLAPFYEVVPLSLRTAPGSIHKRPTIYSFTARLIVFEWVSKTRREK